MPSQLAPRMRHAGIVVWGLILLLSACAPSLSESELAERVQKSSPQWQSYQEDIKAQIGAGPVAEWVGEPIRAAQTPSAIQLTFRLSGPWALRDTAIPVLIRDPLGRVHRNSGATRQDDLVAYDFKLDPAGTSSALPWAEVEFPNGRTRVVFDENGAWSSAS